MTPRTARLMPPLSKRLRFPARVKLALRILTPQHTDISYTLAERRQWARCAASALRGEW